MLGEGQEAEGGFGGDEGLGVCVCVGVCVCGLFYHHVLCSEHSLTPYTCPVKQRLCLSQTQKQHRKPHTC